MVLGERGAHSALMPEGGGGGTQNQFDRQGTGTYLKGHHTGLGVKGVPSHIVRAYPVDVVHTVQHKRVFPSLNKEWGKTTRLQDAQTSNMKMLSSTMMSLCVKAASLLYCLLLSPKRDFLKISLEYQNYEPCHSKSLLVIFCVYLLLCVRKHKLRNPNALNYPNASLVWWFFTSPAFHSLSMCSCWCSSSCCKTWDGSRTLWRAYENFSHKRIREALKKLFF